MSDYGWFLIGLIVGGAVNTFAFMIAVHFGWFPFDPPGDIE